MNSIVQTYIQKPLDEKWYKQLKLLTETLGETFVALMPSLATLEKAKKQFIDTDFQEFPDLHPAVDGIEQIEYIRSDLLALKHSINNEEVNHVVRELYAAKIDELILNAEMILAAKRRDDALFAETNRAIYGLPDPAVFAAVCEWVRCQVLEEQSEYVNDDLRVRILNATPDVKSAINLLPDESVFERVRSLHFASQGYIDQLFRDCDLKDNATYTPLNSDAIVRRVIENVGSSYQLTDSDVNLWAVLQSKQQVVKPRDYLLSQKSFMGIVSHEVGSHLLESINGSRSALRLMELGLDHFEAGNEGRAMIREQIMYMRAVDYIHQKEWSPTKASWEYRIAIYLAISLAVGVNSRQYNFAEIYVLLVDLFTFWTAKRGLNVDNAVIRDGAWSMAVRALKGTDGMSGAYYKDIVYLEGNIRCWQAARISPEIIMWGDLGKFDIANNKHLDALRDLGIVPSVH